jgi:hypothetical protein
MLEGVKKYFFEKKLLADSKSNKSNRALLNLNDAKSIGIAFDATDYSTITAVRDLELKLKQEGKSVSIYGYINNDEKKFEPFLITNKNLNWFGYPKKQQLFEFCRNEFDVLFGFFYDLNSPLNVIFANSKSKLRIGANFNQDVSLFDVIVSSNKIKSSIDTIGFLTDFLIKVKTK